MLADSKFLFFSPLPASLDFTRGKTIELVDSNHKRQRHLEVMDFNAMRFSPDFV
jgi:hypothetical protein